MQRGRGKYTEKEESGVGGGLEEEGGDLLGDGDRRYFGHFRLFHRRDTLYEYNQSINCVFKNNRKGRGESEKKRDIQ